MPIFQAELPMTFLYPRAQATVANRRVWGLHSRHRVDPLIHMEELGLEEEG